MNIDLLFTEQGEAGLICSENLLKKAAGVVFDVESGMITVEYADMDFMEFNIPVDSEFYQALDQNPQIHVGAVKNGKIAQAYQIPFMFLDDPYRMEAIKNAQELPNPLQAFEYFVKSCVVGQPVHREDLGNEDTMGCILGDSSPSSLEFAPHLARRHQMEAAPKAAPNLNMGPSAPGLGSSGGGGGVIRRGTGNTNPPRRPPRDGDDRK